MTGRVSPVLKLSAGASRSHAIFEATDQAASLRATVEEAGLSDAVVTLMGDGRSPKASLVIPFEIRTNVDYEVSIERLAEDECAPRLFASVGSIRPSGAGVSARAAADSKREEAINTSDLALPAILLRGPRISIAGNLNSPENALMVGLAFDLAGPARTCEWKLALRIRIRQTSN
jgi:hypothetical protein